MISVVIPCYKSEKTIRDVVESLIKVLSQRDEKFEIILVNDCSPDNVWEIIKQLKNHHPEVIKGISFTKNFGQHAALLAGYRVCKGDVVVSMDDDGQTDPNQVWKLIDRLDNGYDVVYAKYSQNKESAFRKFGSWLNDKMSEVLIEKPKDIKGTSYNAIKSYVIKDMINYDKSYPYIGGLVYRATNNIGDVDIDHQARKEGKSGYTLSKLIGLTMNGFTAFSVKPLRIASFLGIFFALIGFIYATVIIVMKLSGINIQLGYSSIMSILLIVGGILMFLLGVVGEYIGRIYISINNSPQYVVKETI